MKTLSRKERNFLEREQELIDLALDIMHEEGFVGLTMDKLTARSDFSKGTIYNHFSCKEDVLSAIGICCLNDLNSLFSRAMAFKGNPRERLIAMHVAYMLNARLKSDQFMCVLSCKTSTVKEKSSEKRQLISTEKETQLISLLNDLVREAEQVGDLDVLKSRSIEAVTFSHWATSFGTIALMMHAEESQIVKKLDVEEALLYNICVMLDGLGWKPLSSEWDYLDTIERIHNEVFAPEMEQLNHQ
ncbi:TetR/AcrR family transcriptional regulator [Candidatus Venteria ishoeyi]|uniref:TetR/AcrR family transcriptional regulator n=1 Tax=Candidatus Venteria ishoeyi TaxID=1899563 RepID=UPI0025A642E4|nr:TetR/AcrR family transcriptional regulator [Candidatus Venteria ishoeyi]MDM8546073.1 TetR/AcrR family transcriptional regulator [Candidatus Venteria ishoeyi]